MKKFEHKNKDERRRVLLSKNNELSYTFDNEKLPEGNEAVQANGVGVMAKLGALTRKQLRALVAILVAVCVVLPSLAVFIAKGASNAEGTKLTSVATKTTETTDAITYTVNSGGMDKGVYNITYDGRTYVYRIRFNGEASDGSHVQSTEKLLEGDLVVFNKQTKELTWTYNPAHRGGTDVTTIATPNASGDELTLQTKGAYVKDTTYYYFDSSTNYYYFFEIEDDRLGYKVGATNVIANVETTGNANRKANYQYPRALTEPEMIDCKENPITITIDRDNHTLSLTGNQLHRKQIYIKATSFEDGEFYLIRSNQTNSIIKASTDAVSTNYNDRIGIDTEYNSGYSDCYFKSNNHTEYGILNESNYNEKPFGSEELYKLNSTTFDGTAFTSDEISSYYSGDAEDSLALSEFRAKETTNRVYYNKPNVGSAQSIDVTGYFLFGYHDSSDSNAGRRGFYSSDKTFGKIYNPDSNEVTLFDICDIGQNSSIHSAKTRDYKHNYYAIWLYDDETSQLYTVYRTLRTDTPSDWYQSKYLQNKTNSTYELSNTTSDTFSIYKRTSAYTATELSNSNFEDWYADKLVSDSVSPINITYDETETIDDGLELSKIVTETDNSDVFDVTLEAHMDKNKLNRPDTDIEIVLDTSRAMGHKVYDREYKNLKTYSVFEGVSTASLTHDNLFDNDGAEGLSGALSDFWDLLSASRQFIHNKYVEDPNAPGTYVYLHQEWSGEPSANILHLFYDNHYTYRFTSANGDTYSTRQFDYSAGDVSVKNDKLPAVLDFYKDGTTTDPYEVSTIYHVPGYINEENNEQSLTKNLRSMADSGNLYTKIGDEYKQVGLYSHSGSEAGMFTYYVKDNDSTTADTATYKFTTGGKKKLNPGDDNAPYSGEYGVFQGFRHYILTENDEGETVYRLDPATEKKSLLSKTLYYKLPNNQTTEITGLTAMQEALEEFLLKAHEKAVDNDAIIHVGLVTYDKSSYVDYALNVIDMGNPVGTNTVDTLISHIYNINLTNKDLGGHNTWAAELGQGMHTAYDQMETLSRAGSNRYTLVFTGGKPIAYRTFFFGRFDTTKKTDAFSTSIAEDAIQVADAFKNTLKTTVYTVGAYDNASSTMLNGRAWYYAWRDTWLCDGNPGSHGYWGGSWLANLAGYNIDPTDAYATNRMLAYMSSNYSNATTLGLTRGRYAPGDAKSFIDWAAKQLSKTYGYRITHNNKQTDDGFFFGLSPNTLDDEDQTAEDEPIPDELTETEFKAAMRTILSGIEKATEVAKSKLDANAWLVDGITPYFDLVDGNRGITAQIQKPNGDVVATLSGDNVVYDTDEKTVSVKGFDYKDHFYDDASANSEQAQKLVVKFQIRRDSNFIGGNYVPTNQSKSGVYDGQNNSYPGVLVERFDIPHVDLYLLDVNNYTKNDSVYYACEEDLSKLVNPVWVDGYRNSYVRIEYKVTGNGVNNTYTILPGETTGTWSTPVGANDANLDQVFPQLTDTSQYSVEVKVIPIYDGTYDDETSNESATVYVFKPHFDVHNDTVANAGDKYILTTIPEESWVGYDANDVALSGDTLTEAEGYLKDKLIPNYSYDIQPAFDTATTIATVAAELNDGGDGYNFTVTPAGYDDEETGGTPINAETDFVVTNVNVTPTPFSYDVEGVVEINYYIVEGSGEDQTITLLYSYDPQTNVYYTEDGTPAENQAAAAQEAQGVSEENKEYVTGIITTDVNRQAVNATTNQDVTYLNTNDSDPKRTTGEFTIGLRSHDVTVVNHTTGEQGSDYSDPNKEFPLTFTLKDGNDPVQNEEITYTLNGGSPQTATTNSNGQIVINMKDSDTVVLKEIRDGYALTVTSTPPPGDLYELYAQAGPDADHLTQVNVNVDTETTVPITINDETLIDLIHHIGDIPATLLGNADSKLNPFIIAAGIVAALGGAWLGIVAKRKRQMAEQ